MALLFKGLGKGERRPHVVLGTIYEDIRGKVCMLGSKRWSGFFIVIVGLWESFWFIAYEI